MTSRGGVCGQRATRPLYPICLRASSAPVRAPLRRIPADLEAGVPSLGYEVLRLRGLWRALGVRMLYLLASLRESVFVQVATIWAIVSAALVLAWQP